MRVALLLRGVWLLVLLLPLQLPELEKRLM
jgi:hypothetical protein